MDFATNPEQDQLIAMTREFAREVVAPAQRAMERDDRFPYDAWSQWSALGMAGMLIPEEYGGSAQDRMSFYLCVEELATVSQVFAQIWQIHCGVSQMYVELGTEQQKIEWLPRFASGDITPAFALTEPEAGSDAGSLKTRAVRLENGDWLLNGRKILISNAGTDISDGVVAMAATGEGESGRKEITCFIVPRGTPGYSLGQSFDKMAWHGMDNRELLFDNVRLPDSARLGPIGKGLSQALGALTMGRIGIAVMGIALARACLEESLAYAKNRRQFGRPISDFQLIQAKLADIATGLEAARALTHKAIWICEQGSDSNMIASMAKLVGSRLATKSAKDALQIHGGVGFSLESRVNRLFREAQVLEIGDGTTEIQQLIVARALGC
ncbi:acyl-CoA dehydrogenase [Mesorhizobium sp. L-8-10]|uniref:acyl-CoA dehydrogenase family protein n=1 Tax=Mesorhizobium sp. L-8-10 TaxID=2744523 RepID=UPI0019285724|nr:acyl-CoA dehydrogenase family protein [Mesorhizobium sp. L-8-10]BCH29781.1 acyl-CoA dehydrogenase [Mesorhizobium sp. L-8-10]